MANTYTQLYFHIVICVKSRRCLIAEDWEVELHKYMTGIITNRNQKLMIINGVQNHVHLLIGTKPDCNLSDLIRDVKSHSSKWVNEKGFLNKKFEWQLGFGGFTVSQRGVKYVIKYIENQKEHHKKKSFKEEYIALLEHYEVEYKKEYIFDDV
ncbi:IS200/IS605 family transposase [Crocinitomix catalasitica]|uniref:IS200/IS605 family transposase n=1 Tax=Crocinitomix catalasitica TaxID=184607 RepID=UPI0004860361|nr:IS200/IS605 family transposase [Crocinitomix catalasitica]